MKQVKKNNTNKKNILSCE